MLGVLGQAMGGVVKQSSYQFPLRLFVVGVSTTPQQIEITSRSLQLFSA